MTNRLGSMASLVLAVGTTGLAGAFPMQAQVKRTLNPPPPPPRVAPRTPNRQAPAPGRPQVPIGRPSMQPDNQYRQQTSQPPFRQSMQPRVVVPQYGSSPAIPYRRPYSWGRENRSGSTPSTGVQPVNRDFGGRTGQVVYGQNWRNDNVRFNRTPTGIRIITADRPDHSRVVVMPGGGWVQRPFSFNGTEYARRTYALQGGTFDRFYRHSEYHGIALNVYTPAKYYPAPFYAWAYQPWGRPVVFRWGFRERPWFAAYGFAFQPYGFYGGTSPWLTDFLVANSLEAAYQQSHSDAAQAEFQGGVSDSTYQYSISPSGGRAAQVSNQTNGTIQPIPSDVKTQLAQEVQRQTLELQQNSQSGSLALLNVGDVLSDNQAHTFITGSESVVVDSTGTECSLTAGDLIQYVPPAPLPHSVAFDVQVMWGKSAPKECKVGTRVTVSIEDLQEMHNYMRATVDNGFEKLRAEQLSGTIPSLPSNAAGNSVQLGFVNGAPLPERNVQADLNQQTREADQAEHARSPL